MRTIMLALAAICACLATHSSQADETATGAVKALGANRANRAANVVKAGAPKPAPVAPTSPEALEAAIARGRQFLLSTQNKDGSFGSLKYFRDGDIYAPVPGAHHAFRAATTSLCVSALIEVGANDPAVAAAIDRGERWLVDHLPRVRRATEDAFYNTWAHAYSIQALAKLHRRREGDAARQAVFRRLLEGQIQMLLRYECVDGGWAYYDFEAHTQRPSGSTISFVTATVLVAVDEAKPIGVSLPEPVVQRAIASILRQQKPDLSYAYGEYLKLRPMMTINRPGGSLGRSQVCNLALRLCGDASISDDVLGVWLDRLFSRNLWLDLGRKRPIPHESFFQVAAYFFYYGHYYAARCIEQLPAERRQPHRDQLAHVLLRLQESDGSWWDFPMFGYHQQYGTALALMSLARCR